MNVSPMKNMTMMPGDVFLMCGDAKVSKSLASLQQKIIYQNAKSSHVMISVGDGAFVHSTIDGGVDFAFYPAILNSLKDEWRVIRLRGVLQVQQDELQKAAIYFIDQAYNYKFLIKSNDASSFCSELAVKIYQQAKVPIFGKKDPGKITPAHFDQEADQCALWEDVTATYKAGFKEIDKEPSIYAFGHATMTAAVRKRQMMLRNTDTILQSFNLLYEKGEVSSNLYQTAIEMEATFRKNKNISFWNETPYHKDDKSDDN